MRAYRKKTAGKSKKTPPRLIDADPNKLKVVMETKEDLIKDAAYDVVIKGNTKNKLNL